MELALITAQQVAVLFLLIATGAAAVKTGVLKPEGKQVLSNLLVYIIVPAMIVNSYRMDFSMEILHNLLAAFGMSVLAIFIGTVLTLVLTARRKDRRGLHGLPAYLRPVRLGGSALRQRLCDGVQHPAVDDGLRLCQRQF